MMSEVRFIREPLGSRGHIPVSQAMSLLDNIVLNDGESADIPAIRTVLAYVDSLRTIRDQLILQAQVWAGEAKAQKATVDEVGALLGGVPDWGPIAEKVSAAIAENARLRSALEFYADEENWYAGCGASTWSGNECDKDNICTEGPARARAALGGE